MSINQVELLVKAREMQKANKNKSGTFRKSGEILEDRYEILYPQMKRYAKAMEFDFSLNDLEIDVKGCWAKEYRGGIFIEGLQNPKTGTTPAYMKYLNGEKKIFLHYVDYETGIEYLINWNKLYPYIKDWSMTDGGDTAKGWVIDSGYFSKVGVLKIITKNRVV